MAQVIISPRAERDVEEAISRLSLPPDTWTRIARPLRVLETFPLAGPKLGGGWAPARFVLGPWSWMLLLYSYDEDTDRLFVLSMNDARSVASPRSSLRLGAEGLREEWR